MGSTDTRASTIGLPTVGLLGATGYTGRLTAAELARRGVCHRLGGRNPDRLATLPRSPLAEPFVVDTAEPGRLVEFLDRLDVVISCVGPFARYGLPVVAAAVATRVPYVDSTGETDFMRAVYERYADAPTPVVPACGFDYAPGDLAAAIAAEEAGGGVTDVVVAYELHGAGASRGTARSGLGMIRTARFVPCRLAAAFPEGSRSAFEIPWGEEVTVPRHLPGARVRSGLVAPAVVAYALDAVAPLLPYTRPLTRLVDPLVERAVERMPEGPPASRRQATRFRVLAQASGPRGGGRVLVEGHDPYGLTAVTLVEAALTLSGAGAQAPAQALRPRAFLDAVSGPLLRWRVL